MKILPVLLVSLFAVFAPATVAFADLNAHNSGTTVESPVAPGSEVSVHLKVGLDEGDGWKRTRVQVSIPGPNNDIDVCVDTTDRQDTVPGTFETSNNFTFTAPSTPGEYEARFTAYENNNCNGGKTSDTVTKDFTVMTDAEACALGGGEWLGDDCYTLEEQEADCLGTGGLWQGDDCYTLEEQGYDCVLGGSYWTGTECEPIPSCDANTQVYNEMTNGCNLSPEAQCLKDGNTWNGECIRSSGGGMGISIGVYEDEELCGYVQSVGLSCLKRPGDYLPPTPRACIPAFVSNALGLNQQICL